jgi:hypothetical protein
MQNGKSGSKVLVDNSSSQNMNPMVKLRKNIVLKMLHDQHMVW